MDINVATAKAAALPGDPDNMNLTRSTWAEAAVVTFMGCTRTDREDAIADLLTDLMHLCDRGDTSFENELARAKANYEIEIGNESTGEYVKLETQK